MPTLSLNPTCRMCNREKTVYIGYQGAWGFICKHCIDSYLNLSSKITLHLHNF